MTTTTRVGLLGFTILVHKAEEGETGYWGEARELPGCLSQGETVEELLANMQEAIAAVSPYAMTESSSPPHHLTTSPPTSTTTA